MLLKHAFKICLNICFYKNILNKLRTKQKTFALFKIIQHKLIYFELLVSYYNVNIMHIENNVIILHIFLFVNMYFSLNMHDKTRTFN